MPNDRSTQPCGLPFKLSLLHPKYWLTWLGIGLFALISLLPTRLRHTIGKLMGRYVFKKNGKRRKIVISNLRIAFPHLTTAELESMALQHLQWYGCALIDYSLLFFASKKRLAGLVTLKGEEQFDEIIQKNQNIVLLLAHSVMLEYSAVALGVKHELFASYKNSKNAVIDWIIAYGRCRYVSFTVSREEGLRKLVKSIKPGKVMIFLPDEDLGIENAVFAPFYSKEKATLSTTARLVKMSKAKALPIYVYFDIESQKYVTEISTPLEHYPSGDARLDASNMNQCFEKLINKNPEQYMWLMKWYKTRPKGEHSVY